LIIDDFFFYSYGILLEIIQIGPHTTIFKTSN
jgi:hypothetical protein